MITKTATKKPKNEKKAAKRAPRLAAKLAERKARFANVPLGPVGYDYKGFDIVKTDRVTYSDNQRWSIQKGIDGLNLGRCATIGTAMHIVDKFLAR